MRRTESVIWRVKVDWDVECVSGLQNSIHGAPVDHQILRLADLANELDLLDDVPAVRHILRAAMEAEREC